MINFSELLWKSGERTEGRSNGASRLASEDRAEFTPALELTLADTVDFGPDSRLPLLLDPQSAGADRLRYVRMQLRELRGLAKLQSLVITSPVPRDGKSTMAICLATALVEKGDRTVLLIEADLHRPTLAKTLGVPRRSGLAECLEGGQDPISQLRKIEPLGWYLLQAGEPSTNPTELLQGEALSDLIRKVSPYFEWILVDTPPTLPLMDALSASRQVDGTLLVARADVTSRPAIQESVKLIGRKHIVGMILNGAEGLGRLYSAYYGNYDKK